MKSITIFIQNNTNYYEVGQKLIKDEKKTDITVSSIKIKRNKIKINLSSGSTLEFVGVKQYIIAK